MAVHEKAGTLVRICSPELAVENKGIGSKWISSDFTRISSKEMAVKLNELAVPINELAEPINESAVNELAVWKT